MTPNELKNCRKRLGMSCRQFAVAIGMTSQWADRTVRKWESGKHPIPHWVEIVIDTIP